MNKIVRQHYSAAKLPAELREGIDPAREVTVTVTEEDGSEEPTMTIAEIFAARRPPFRSVDEIVAEIRSLRGEWDER